jgi:ABC-2 type transport system ATP-binding protein
MLELRNVSKRFSGSLAVDSISFRARAGEVTGYLGPNGSGKSSTNPSPGSTWAPRSSCAA